MFGIDSDDSPTFVPKSVYYRCAACRSDNDADDRFDLDLEKNDLLCVNCRTALTPKRSQETA